MKVIQVGLGDFGFGWLKDILLRRSDIQILGVVDRNQDLLNKAKALTGMENTEVFTDLNEALLEFKPDFILNITPPSIHKEINFVAIEQSIPILSEKPIAETYSEAKKILEKSRELKVPVMIAENYRYNNIVRTVQKLVSSGEIGRIGTIHIDFYRNHRMTNYHKNLKYPLLLDVTIHHMDMVRYVTGVEGEKVFARSWTPEWSWYNGYSNLDLLLDMENGIRVAYRGSLSSLRSETNWLGNWRIEGEKGILTMYDGQINIYKNDSDKEIRVTEFRDSRKLVLEEFINSLANGKVAETDITDNIKTFEIVAAAIRSIENNEIVKL